MARGRNNNNSKRGTDEFRKEKSTAMSNALSGNDYFINEQMKKDVGSFNWTYPIGMREPHYRSVARNDGAIGAPEVSYPMLTTFLVQPTIGISKDPNSATNQLARTMFNYIVRINSKNVSYEPVDLQIGIVAMDSVYSCITWMMRLYATATTYSAENRGIPDILFDANHVDMDDFLDNVEDFRSWLNIYIQRASLLAIPKDIPYFRAHSQLYSNLYVDEQSEKAQMYMFVPDCFYKLDETFESDDSDTVVRSLLPVPLMFQYNGGDRETQFSDATASSVPVYGSRPKLKVDDIKALAEELLSPLLASEDLSFMCSDIFQAYGANGLIKLPLVPENMTLTATHDYKMLQAIENMTIFGRAQQGKISSSGAVTYIGNWWPVIGQDADVNKGNLTFEYVTYFPKGLTSNLSKLLYENLLAGKTLNWHGDGAITPEDVVNMTRFTPSIQVSNTNEGLTIGQCGTEIIVGMHITCYNYTRGVRTTNKLNYNRTIFDNSTTYPGAMHLLGFTSCFNFFPELKFAFENNVLNEIQSIWEIDRYTFLSNENLEKLHTIVLLGMFRTPGYPQSIISR